MHTSSILTAASLAIYASASGLGKREVRPQSHGVRMLGNVTDPSVSRDSCNSVKMGNRVFWTCRDTSIKSSDNPLRFNYIFANTVAWTDYAADGTPAVQHQGPYGAGSSGSNSILLMQGPSPKLPLFFPMTPDMCSSSGLCDDGTRWVGWPNQPPMVSETGSDGTITSYSWVEKYHISGISALNPEPPTTLYKMTYKPDSRYEVVPNVQIIDSQFWAPSEIGYGTLGNVVHNGTAYLYGKLSTGGIALSKVPVGSVEDKSKYQYFVNGAWTSKRPAIGDKTAEVKDAGAGGQGTYYYSDVLKSFVWIGQPGIGVQATFFITTAPSPEGPWISPYLLYRGQDGDSPLPAYSLQAHPHMLRAGDNGIYLTWTQNFKESTYGAYVTPLVYVSFN